MNERATFVAAQSVAAGCPGATFPPPFVPATATRDPRCGNDAQALGPFTNGGTYPASSTLENYGVSFVAEWDVSERADASNRSPRAGISTGPARATRTIRRC